MLHKQTAGTAPSGQEALQGRIDRNRRRLGHNCFLIMLAAIICFLVIRCQTPDRQFSETENRPLAQFPPVSFNSIADGSFFFDLDHWFSDQFVERDRWTAFHLDLLKLAGFQESGGVYLGSDGSLMLESAVPDEAVVESTVSAMNRLAEEHPEIHTTAILVPNAASVQTALAPENMPTRDQNADLADFKSGLSDTITCLDVGTILAEHADEYIYYRTDHHWTSLGAKYTFEAAIDALDIREYVTEYTAYTVTDSFQGTLAHRSGSHQCNDSIDIYLPQNGIDYYLTKGEDNTRSCSIYDSSALSVSDKYTVFLGGNYSKVEIRTTADNGRKLLLFKDSYANSFVQFLIPCYEEIIMIDPRYYYGSMDELLSRHITDVLYLYSADTILVTPTLRDVLSSYKQEAAGAEPALEPIADDEAAPAA